MKTLILLLAVIPVSASAAALSFAQQKQFDSICASFLIPSCDSCSISECSRGKNSCRIAAHLAKFAEWLVEKKENPADCMKDLRRRYDCLTAPKTSHADFNNQPVAGDPKAPVIIAMYVFDMCPMCTYLFVELHREVTSGILKKKARLVAKLFDGSADSVAKARFPRFWDYIATLSNPVARNDGQMPVAVIDSTDKYPPAYRKLVHDLRLRTKAVAFREQDSKEASINPPVFINNKRYRSYNNPQWIVDAALYEFEMLRKPGGDKTTELPHQ